MTENLSDRVRSTPEGLRLFEQESLIVDVTERISALMEAAHLSKADLAARLGKSKAYVTQLLGGETNMTLRTVADVFTALGHRAQVTAVDLPRAGDAPATAAAPLIRPALKFSQFCVERTSPTGARPSKTPPTLSA